MVETSNQVRDFFKKMTENMIIEGKTPVFIPSLEQVGSSRINFRENYVLVLDLPEIRYNELDYGTIYAKMDVHFFIVKAVNIDKFEEQNEIKNLARILNEQVMAYLYFCKYQTVEPFNALKFDSFSSLEIRGDSVGNVENCFGNRISFTLELLPNFNQNLNFWKTLWVQPSQ